MIQTNTSIKLFVNNIINEGISNIQKSCTSAHNAFIRCTFITMNTCYVCDQYNTETRQLNIDSYIGRMLLYGWIYCPKCKPFVLIDKDYRERNLDVLPFSTYKHLGDIDLKFWRKSKTTNIKSYLVENAKLNIYNSDAILFKLKYNRLAAAIYWVDNKELEKAIPFANLIFYNRNIFGYNTNYILKNVINTQNLINDKKWKDKWSSYFDIEYTHANGWLEFYKIAIRNKIPREIILKILDIWGNFFL